VVLCAAALAEPSLRGIFMPPLLAKWAALSDADAELLPLMECLMTIATALGGAALWETVDQYSRSITIILVMADHSAGTADASPCHLLRVCMCLVVHPRLLEWLCNRVGECGLLMTCWLCNIAGPAFEEFAEPLFQRCMRILSARLVSRQMAAKVAPLGPSLESCELAS
jgi:hypothetical protein